MHNILEETLAVLGDDRALQNCSKTHKASTTQCDVQRMFLYATHELDRSTSVTEQCDVHRMFQYATRELDRSRSVTQCDVHRMFLCATRELDRSRSVT